jgi:zona occludens toxin (predicted ATPase)
MIRISTGTPGSGKSFSMAELIEKLLLRGKNVISTVEINIGYITKNGKVAIGDFKHIDIYEIDVDFLYRYAIKNHKEEKRNKEAQTYVFFDECQLIFNSREYQSNKDRKRWIEFFTHHRHFFYDIYLITQNDLYVDKQIRALVENEVKFRKINNFLWFLPIQCFVSVETWYAHSKKVKMRSKFFIFRRRIARLYDSYTMFQKFKEKYTDLADERDGESLAEKIPAITSAEAFSRRRRDGGFIKMVLPRLKKIFKKPLENPLEKAPLKT